MKQKTIFNRLEFRGWLDKNHLTEKKLAARLYKKHTGKQSPTHRELMEEAICFGWIDTTVKRIDEDTYIRMFSKRNTNSSWSNNTQGYAKDLIKQGKMTKEGLKFYKLGLKKPTHDFGIPENPDMPFLLKQALEKNKIVKDTFLKFNPSTKKMLYRWIIRAKLTKTKEQRVQRILKMVKTGKIKLTSN